VTPEALEVLRLRNEISQASVKKYPAFVARQYGSRIHGAFQYCGAGRTGRWAGRGVQLHNLKRTPKDVETLSSLLVEDPDLFDRLFSLEDLGCLVRQTISAEQEKLLVVSDLSSIESRVLGWMSGCVALNQVFKDGKDPYKDFASDWFEVFYDDVTKEQRTLAKPPVLGCGYQLGAPGLVSYADSMGIEMDLEEQAKPAVHKFRSRYWEIPKLWETCVSCVYEALQTGGSDQQYFEWRKEGDFLTCKLPSGRKLHYFKPAFEEVPAPWDRKKKIWSFTYEGMDQYTRKWRRLSSHGGKIVENLDQAVSRDILLHGMMLYTQNGGSVVGHVHDECIAEEDERVAPEWLDFMSKCLSVTPSWAPGLLLGAEGYVSKRYRKD